MKNLGPYRLNPTGKFNPERQYKFLDMLEYKGSSYVCINDDIIDGVSNIGVLPIGEEKSEIYFQLIASCGAEGPRAEKYDGFVRLTDDSVVWDYNVTDKIIIPAKGWGSSAPSVEIINAYDGCCGMILSDYYDLVLPENSNESINFNLISTWWGNRYYMFTFVALKDGTDSLRFIWNRNTIQGVLPYEV